MDPKAPQLSVSAGASCVLASDGHVDGGRTDEARHEQENKNATSRLQTERDAASYFSLASLFFSELTNEPALDIDLLDTLFFQPDHSVCYLYKDARKGLTRTKQRGINACEAFLKRKARKREPVSSKERLRKYRAAMSE